MVETVLTIFGDLQTWVLALASSVWVYPAMFAFACIDGFFPPIPSESVIIALAVSAVATGNPSLVLVVLVAAAGAWVGDQIAYAFGRSVGTDRLRILRSVRGRRAIAWADRALTHRGASFILAARYIPVGRVAVNMTAGALGYPRRRFMGLTALAATTWALYSVMIGVVAGQWLSDSPLLAMAVGVVAGTAAGIVLDRAMQPWVRRRAARARTTTRAPVPVGPAAVTPVAVAVVAMAPVAVVPGAVAPLEQVGLPVVRPLAHAK